MKFDIRLETADGKLLAIREIEEARGTPPTVILWGQAVFALLLQTKPPVYRQVTFTILPTEEPR